MLVLSRRRDEVILMDFAQMTNAEFEELKKAGPVAITVVDVHGDKVRVGVTAPRSVQVHRKEVYEAIKKDGVRLPPGP